MANNFKVGDKVRLNRDIKDFEHGRGGVSYEEVGTLKRIGNDNEISIVFPSMPYWSGLLSEIVKVEFTKADLQEGDRLTLRNGATGYYSKDMNINYLRTSNINDDLTNDGASGKTLDIIKVERPVSYTTVYEREEVKEMTLKEVCDALGYEVKIVKEDK